MHQVDVSRPKTIDGLMKGLKLFILFLLGVFCWLGEDILKLRMNGRREEIDILKVMV